MMSPGSLPNGTPTRISSPSAVIPRPRKTSRRPMIASRTSNQLDACEEVADLVRRRVGRVGSVRGVALDRLRELFSKRPRIGFRRIGRAHQRAPFLDRVLRLEHEDDAWTRRHECGEARKKRTRAMDVVEAFGLLL